MEFEKVIDQLVQIIRTDVEREHRMLSKTFWNMFGYKVRTPQRIERVYSTLQSQGISPNFK